jgi:hypothetical protein
VLLAVLATACADSHSTVVSFPVPATAYALDDVRLVLLEHGDETSLDSARFELRGFLQRTRRAADESPDQRPAATGRADAGPAFYPAPAGYQWFAIDPAARIAVRSLISAQELALARIDDGVGLTLRDFVIHGEEDAAGQRAMRLEVIHTRAAAFNSLLERARGGQLLFVVPGRVLLAVDITAPVKGEFWLLGLPVRGESEFVDRLARVAVTPS